MKVPFVDLSYQYAELREEIADAIARVLDSGQFILGDEVSQFEDCFAKYCDCRYGIGVSSGTAALHLALLGCGIGPGTSVITVPNTFVATVEAIVYIGARPIFVDVDATANMDVSLIEKAIEPDTRAIVPVHLYGQPADMPAIIDIAERHDLVVIEDACQAHGSAYQYDKHYVVARPGTFSDAACFSFYPAKNLGCLGDGGIVVTRSYAFSKKLRALRNHGQIQKNRHDAVGYNYRLDALQAAVLAVKLPHLNKWNGMRQSAADRYSNALRATDLKPISVGRHVMFHSNHLYVALAPDTDYRDDLRQSLAEAGIATGLHYPVPVHLQPAYKSLGYTTGDFPMAEDMASRLISLPMYPGIDSEQIDYVISKIMAFSV